MRRRNSLLQRIIEQHSPESTATAAMARSGAASRRKILLSSVLLGLISLAFLAARIQYPPSDVFDESAYLSVARGLLSGSLPPLQIHSPVGRQHPPLGSFLISAGMWLAGDNPAGWRLASVVAGAATAVGIFLLTYLLVQDYSLALTAAALTLFNNFLYVISRVAMLDVFTFAFCLWGVVAFVAAMQANIPTLRRRVYVTLSGIAFGLGAACKWNAVDSLAVVLVSAIALYAFRSMDASGWSAPAVLAARNMRQIGLPVLLLAYTVLPAGIYVVTFVPLFHATHTEFSLHELGRIHALMLALNKNFPGNRALAAPWYRWPFRTTPLRSFSYLMGNWVVMWDGIAALAVGAWRLRRRLYLAEAMLLMLYLANWLQWAVTPLKVPHYYYYYPAAMVLGPAIAAALRRSPVQRVLGVRLSIFVVLVAFAFFLYCFPRMAHLEAPWDCMFGCWD